MILMKNRVEKNMWIAPPKTTLRLPATSLLHRERHQAEDENKNVNEK
jgi:hypothetical protein